MSLFSALVTHSVLFISVLSSSHANPRPFFPDSDTLATTWSLCFELSEFVSSFAASSMLPGRHQGKHERGDGEGRRQEPHGLSLAVQPLHIPKLPWWVIPAVASRNWSSAACLLPSNGAYTGHCWARPGQTQIAHSLYKLQMLQPEMFLLIAWGLAWMITVTDWS